MNDAFSPKLRRIAESAGYRLDHRKWNARRQNGWPQESLKPYHLLYSDGSHCASFATEAALEKALRARAGC